MNVGVNPAGFADADQTAPIALVDVTKVFGGTVALRDASFQLRRGEVLALLGENGAGKSTCVKLLAGVHAPTEGGVQIDGIPVTFRSPHDAQAAGVAVMHQHPGLFPDLSVAENIYIGHMPRDRFGGIDNAAESFWIIKHGIKMSAMPAWGKTQTDAQMWAMVAFLAKVKDMTPAQYAAAVAAGGGTAK